MPRTTQNGLGVKSSGKRWRRLGAFTALVLAWGCVDEGQLGSPGGVGGSSGSGNTGNTDSGRGGGSVAPGSGGSGAAGGGQGGAPVDAAEDEHAQGHDDDDTDAPDESEGSDAGLPHSEQELEGQGGASSGSGAGGAGGFSSEGSGGSGGSSGDTPELEVAPTLSGVPTLANCDGPVFGTLYEVGPGQPYTELSAVPFGQLTEGDMVRIHHRAEPYRAIVLLSGVGTAEHPIRICGVRSQAGERPVISGDGAITPTTMGMADVWNQIAVIFINRKTTDDYFTARPAHIVVEGLKVQGAHEGVTFTNVLGGAQIFDRGAACIYALRGEHITVRDNEVTDCGFGIFAKSGNPDAEQVKDVLIEGNYVHDNNPGEYDGIHNLYIQAVGVTYQFNHFGPPRGASNVKDRSVGTIFRYNWVEPAAHHNLDLVEAEEYKEAAVLDPRYRQAFVYGNIFHQIPGGVAVHYGADHLEAENVPYFRKGNLYLYHNTIRYVESEPSYYSRSLFVVTTVEETLRLFNNVIYFDGNVSHLQLIGYKEVLSHLEQGGHFIVGKNWINQNWERNDKDSDPYVLGLGLQLGSDGEIGMLDGSENFVSTPALPVDVGTYRPAQAIADLAEAIPAELANAGHAVAFQYDVTAGDPTVPLTQIQPRIMLGSGAALGALEEE